MPRKSERREYGGHLSPNHRGIFVWRRTHPITGDRAVRSTGQRTISMARKRAQEWEDEFDRAEVGLGHLNGWTKELRPLIPSWVESMGGGAEHVARMKSDLERALTALGLTKASDLDALAALEDRLRELERKGEASRTSLRRSYQAPLKRFSAWLAGNRRHLDRDPLALWEPIKREAGRARKGRAAEPGEMARALLAIDRLNDRAPKGSFRQRATFTALLVTAPRATAFASRDVGDLLEDRIDLGPGNAIKRRGRAALDPTTAAELRAAVGERKAGPLFPSAQGKRWEKTRMLARWQEAFGLGVVDALWPADEPRDLALAVDVARALFNGRHLLDRGGNPNLVKDETKKLRAKRAGRVQELVERLRDDWEEAMDGVTLHGFRSTHRTWAEARGVPPPAIDLQLGWAQDEDQGKLNVMRMVAGSQTGRRHYLDLGSQLLDPASSAIAVRAVLDEALAAIAAEGTSMLLPRADEACARARA